MSLGVFPFLKTKENPPNDQQTKILKQKKNFLWRFLPESFIMAFILSSAGLLSRAHDSQPFSA